MSGISKPDINIALLSANNVLNIGTRRDLIVAQNPGSSSNELFNSIEDKTQTELDTLFGASSFIRFLVQEWLDANQTGNNVKAELDVIALAPAGGAVASTGTITFAGTATADGTITMNILSEKKFEETVSVSSGDAAAAVGVAVSAAYASVAAPFSVADNASGVVTITATDLGTAGNFYGMKITGVPAGLTATLAAFSGGTGEATVTGAFDLVGGVRYQGILWPTHLFSTIAEMVDFLDARFNSANEILDGVGFIGDFDTLTNLKSGVNAQNSQSLVALGNSIVVAATNQTGPIVTHPPDWSAAEFMANRARRLTEEASISSIVTTNAGGDQFGGSSLASLPYFNTPFNLTALSISEEQFDDAEQNELNTAGFSVMGANRPGTDMIAGTVVTTYKKDAAGNDDISFKFLEFVDTASVVREFLFVNLKSEFAQTRLTDGDLIPGRSMANADSIKAVFLRFMAILADLALVQGGREAAKAIENATTVTTNLAGRSVTINSILPPVTQLEGILVPLKLSFTL